MTLAFVLLLAAHVVVQVWLARRQIMFVQEVSTLRTLLERQLADYRRDTQAADDLLKTGFAQVPDTLEKAELAAWTHLARVLLNLLETITRS